MLLNAETNFVFYIDLILSLAPLTAHFVPQLPESKTKSSKHQAINDDKLDTSTAVQELQRFLKPVTAIEAQLIADVEKIKADKKDLASGLQSLGYIVRSVKNEGGGEGVICFQNLRHEYLEVFVPGDIDRFIVDERFKDQFIIASPTDRYSSLLACIPSILVIQEDLISHLVAFMCKEMTAAFKEAQKEIPPWRKFSSMLTKWPGKENIEQQTSRDAKGFKRRSLPLPSRDQEASDRNRPSFKPITRLHGGFSLLSQAMGHLAT